MSASTLVCAQTQSSNAFLVHKLVSDLPNVADHQDTNLINPWGNGFGSTPFWVGNNHSGTATLYDGYGVATALVVSIPAAGGANSGGPVTGVIFNSFSSNAAVLNAQSGKPASFLFCSEDGIISGWNSSADATHALVVVDNSKSGAIYKGCALGGTASAPLLFAANFSNGSVDVFDGKFAPVTNSKAFVDPAVPAGFAPFNVQIMNGGVYVTFAKQDAQKHDDVAGAGNGYVALFDMSGNLISNLIAQGSLNSPWGMAIAPASFGPFAGALLVGNFGDGKINGFSLPGGASLGALNDTTGSPFAMPGLWSLNFGSGARNEDAGTLYFTAGVGGGPNNDPVESHGLLGSIQAAPSFTTTGIQNGASFLSGPIAANEWASIIGSGLSATTAGWQVTGTQLPTQLNGVSVTVNGESAPISFIGNSQINFLVPADIQPGSAQVQVKGASLSSPVITVNAQPMAPGFFSIGTNATTGAKYVAATHADGSLIGPASVIKGATPAKPGETIVLYGAGFGPGSSTIPNGQVVSTPITLPVKPLIIIDGTVANVTYAGLTGTGLYQINVVVPTSVQAGADDLVTALIGNTESQPNAYLTIAAQ
ncbi:MAG TPA: TIGR03118 family protein [Bryobacteraceae bacterium]|nr:TIGR03118 family protein [Bryobacteraceae bacterium]